MTRVLELSTEARVKACSKCAVVQSCDEFYAKASAGDGLASRCRTCYRADARAWAAKNRDRTPAPTVARKRCTWCHAEKDAEEFYPRPIAHDGLTTRCADCLRMFRRAGAKRSREQETAYTRRWREANRERHDAYMKAYRRENRDHIRAMTRQWERLNSERLAEMKRRWFEQNREAIMAWREENRERVAATARRSALKNRDKRAEAQRQRNVVKRGGTVTDVDLASLWNGFCGICDESLDERLVWPDPLSKSLDHIYPISLGGDHVKGNLQWAHLRCNVAKGNRVSDVA